jgi:glycosyltransferase involved in cell wall biosynthesis
VRSVSIVLPARDEADNISSCVAEALAALDVLGVDGEVVVVDDGSVDGTAERAAVGDIRVRVVRNRGPHGYGAALRSGFVHARGSYVFITDADLQFDISELGLLLEVAGERIVVAGYRSPRRDPLVRRVLGWTWSRFAGGALGLRVRDLNCAFKLFPRELVMDPPLRSDGAFVNAELLARASVRGFTVLEVPVSHHPRHAGAASGARPDVALRAVRDLVVLRGELRRGTQR